jgi:hypothetical protein
MALDLKCPNCKEMIRNPVVEPSTDVKIPNATLYDYRCPLCRILLLADVDQSLPDESILERIKHDWPSEA